MFLSLEQPAGKQVSIFVHNLVPEKNFGAGNPIAFGSERFQANSAISTANEQLGAEIGGKHKALELFHQFNWRSSTGWESWSRDNALMLRLALLVAKELNVAVHVHRDVMMRFIIAATDANIEFEFDLATFEDVVNEEFEFIKTQIDQGAYLVLKNIRLPNQASEAA